MNSLQFPPGIDYAQIATNQQREGNTPHAVPNLATLTFGDNIQAVCDRTTGVSKPVVPVILRRKTFDTLHGLAHPDIKVSVRLIIERFAWNGLQKDAHEWTRCCTPCQTTKVHRHNKAHFGTFDVPDARFHLEHINLVGPLSPSRGHRFLRICVDRFTRWCEPIPLVGSHTKAVTLDFLHNWIV